MLCSKLYCQKGFDVILFSYKILNPQPSTLSRGQNGGTNADEEHHAALEVLSR